MRKFIIGFIAILLFVNSSYGQETTKNDSIEAYNKVNKWAVVKLTIAYMEDLKSWPPSSGENEYNKSAPIEVETYKELKKSFDIYADDIDLEQVDEMLAKGWGKTKDGVFKKYKSELFDSILKNNFINVLYVPEGTLTTNNREKALVQINKKYNSLLPRQEKEVVKVNEEGVVPLSADLKTNIEGDVDKSNSSAILLYSLLAISVLLNLVLFFNLKSKKKGDKAEEKSTYEEFYKIQITSLERERDKYKDELSQIKEERSNNSHSSNLGDKVIKPIDNPIEDEKPKVIEFSDVTPMKLDSNKIIYFPSPFEERRFAVEDVKDIEQPTSLYVADIDKSKNKGIITLIETADLSRALNSPNIYLETVCEYENAYNPIAKGIKVVKDGEVILEGEDWVVTSKIRIKFI